MFGRIFPISVGVRAHFASGPHALSRVAAREKFSVHSALVLRARVVMNNTSESGLLAPLSFLLSIAGARSQILEIHVENTCTNQTSDRRPTDRRAARGEENFGVGRRSVGNSLLRRRVRSLFPCFGPCVEINYLEDLYPATKQRSQSGTLGRNAGTSFVVPEDVQTVWLEDLLHVQARRENPALHPRLLLQVGPLRWPQALDGHRSLDGCHADLHDPAPLPDRDGGSHPHLRLS